MELRNKIVNYFVIPSGHDTPPRVVRAPVTMNAETAFKLISKQFKKEGKPIPESQLLHVCYDFDSGMIYSPNARDFEGEKLQNLLKAAQFKITKDFGGFSSRPIIKGSPFSSIRVRSINSFRQASDIIGKHYKGKAFKDIPVIEAYLDRMPSTVKTLPEDYRRHKDFMGGYISPNYASSIKFVEEYDNYGKKLKEPILLLNQQTPFILINISGGKEKREPTATDKESLILNAYTYYLKDLKSDDVEKEKYAEDDLRQFADLYSIKHYLYMGFSFEEVCSLLLSDVTDLMDLFRKIDKLMMASNSLTLEGYDNPAAIPYYLSFKIDGSFPINMASIISAETNRVDTVRQYKYFMIIDYDFKNSNIIVQTPVYIPIDVCEKVLKPAGPIFMSHYNPMMNTVDVKSDPSSLKALKKDQNQFAKIEAINKAGLDEDKKEDIIYRTGEGAQGAYTANPMIFNTRKVSEYYYAYDYIKKMCDKLGIPFKDFNVVVGPLERLGMERGSIGGFMDETLFKKNDMKIPTEIEEGIKIYPPVIFINSTEKPSAPEQSDTLIHEYRHYLYGLEHPDYEISYAGEKPGEMSYWAKYFSDPNEVAAHKEQIKQELLVGKSFDEIIRDKVGGKITTENYPIARKFKEIVDECIEELEREGEENEEPIGESERSR